MLAVAHQSVILPELALLVLGLVAIAIAVSVALVWDREPWWRKTPKPKRELKDCKDEVKIWKVKQKFPDAFKDKG
jgi:hypothetical protein